MEKFRFSSKTLKGFYLGLLIFGVGSYVLAIGAIVLALMVQLGGVLATLFVTAMRLFQEIKNNSKPWAISAYAHLIAFGLIVAMLISSAINYGIQSKLQETAGIVGDGTLTIVQQDAAVQNVADAIYDWRAEHPNLPPNDLAIIEGAQSTDPNVGILLNGSSDEANPESLYAIGLADESLYCLYLPPTEEKQKVQRIFTDQRSDLHSAGQFAQNDCELLNFD